MKKLLTNFYNWLADIFDVIFNLFLNLIMGKSSISIKKVLAYLTFFLIAYVVIYEKNTEVLIQLILLLLSLIGIRSYDKTKYVVNEKNSNPIGFINKDKEEEKG